jgi:hypothetical protein
MVYAKNVKDSVTAAIGTGREHPAPFIAKTHSKRFNLLAALLPRPKAPADWLNPAAPLATAPVPGPPAGSLPLETRPIQHTG